MGMVYLGLAGGQLRRGRLWPDPPPRIVITYCTQCQWLLRAAWMAQELLLTFGTDLGEVALSPGTGGVFEITYDGTTIWERKADGDHLDPGRDLGHIDRGTGVKGGPFRQVLQGICLPVGGLCRMVSGGQQAVRGAPYLGHSDCATRKP